MDQPERPWYTQPLQVAFLVFCVALSAFLLLVATGAVHLDMDPCYNSPDGERICNP